MTKQPIYLDYSATTPLDPKVHEAMQPFLKGGAEGDFGNPSSQHQMGWRALRAVDQGRSQVAQLIGARSKEIVFTSGATEANAMALLGFIMKLRLKEPHRPLHALSSPIEHKSVLETFTQLKELGVETEFVPPNSLGQIEVSEIEKRIRPETVLMSFMWANNEIGSLNPIPEIAALASKNKICFHCDATQIIGKIPLDLKSIPVDLLTLSGHKFYGPKGVGALYLRHEKHHPTVDLWPLVRGGGQEHGLRSGTLNVTGIVGIGAAAQLAQKNQETDQKQIISLTQNFLDQLKSIYPKLQLNGSATHRLPGHLHLTFPGIRWDQCLPRMSHLCISSTSACSSESAHGSHVLQALGFSPQQMQASIRISLGKFTSREELASTLELFQQVFNERPSV